jgi:hypothetical protein
MKAVCLVYSFSSYSVHNAISQKIQEIVPLVQILIMKEERDKMKVIGSLEES